MPPQARSAGQSLPRTLAQARGSSCRTSGPRAPRSARKIDAEPRHAPRRRMFQRLRRRKPIRAHRAEDVQTALREAAAGEPLSILQCGDLWRAHSALTGPGPYREQPAQLRCRPSIVARLHERQLLGGIRRGPARACRKLDVLSSRGCSKPATSGAARCRSLENPPAPAHPGAPAVADHRRPGFFADSAVAGHPDPGRTVVVSPGRPRGAPARGLSHHHHFPESYQYEPPRRLRYRRRCPHQGRHV